jgi:large subunit ribosomal protein L6
VEIPGGVKVALESDNVVVEGPKGKLSSRIASGVAVDVGEKSLSVSRNGDDRTLRANQGLMRSLISNMIEGVTKGYKRALVISGVGYRAELSGKKLTLHLGYSHPVVHNLPEGVDVKVDKNTRIEVSGIDKQVVGQLAAVIRATKIPDPYKIKGITYEGERIKKKAGKKTVA